VSHITLVKADSCSPVFWRGELINPNAVSAIAIQLRDQSMLPSQIGLDCLVWNIRAFVGAAIAIYGMRRKPCLSALRLRASGGPSIIPAFEDKYAAFRKMPGFGKSKARHKAIG
jgi:hypothetical protein